MQEIWRDIKDYEGLYQVSNLGRVKNVKRNSILKTDIERGGYFRVTLYKNGKPKHYLIHRLVAQAFVYNQDPVKNVEVDHINTIRTDNRAENLEWVDKQKNHRNPITREHYGKSKSKVVLQYDLGDNLIKEWESIMQVERELGISQPSISNCCTGRSKTAAGYRWAYKT